MSGQYIPDLTERFPEGFDGVDLTDRYFPMEKGFRSYDLEEQMYMQYGYNIDEIEDDYHLDNV